VNFLFVTCGELRPALGVTLREAERETCTGFLSQNLKVDDSFTFSLSLWLKNNGSTERNSIGVYQNDERLKTCYGWRRRQAC